MDDDGTRAADVHAAPHARRLPVPRLLLAVHPAAAARAAVPASRPRRPRTGVATARPRAGCGRRAGRRVRRSAQSHDAARLLGLPVDRDDLVHLTRTRSAGVSQRPGLRTHRAPLSPHEVLVHRGRPVTTPVRTWLDLAAGLPPVPLVVLGDAVARRTGLERLRAAVDGAWGRRGAPRVRQALPLVDPGSDSPGETHTRLLLHGAGLTGLQHGVRVLDEHGQWLATPDLADRRARVAVQYDGLVNLEQGPRLAGRRRPGRADPRRRLGGRRPDRPRPAAPRGRSAQGAGGLPAGGRAPSGVDLGPA